MTTPTAPACPHCGAAYEALADGSMPRFCPRCGGSLTAVESAPVAVEPRCPACGELVGVAMEEGSRCGSCGQLIV